MTIDKEAEPDPKRVELALKMVEDATSEEGPGFSEMYAVNVRLKQEFRTLGEMFMSTSFGCFGVNIVLTIIIAVLLYLLLTSTTCKQCEEQLQLTNQRVSVLQTQMQGFLETMGVH